VYLVRIGGDEAVKHADELYEELKSQGIEVLYDDRDERPGAKFADSELMGIPHRVTVSDRMIEAGKYEYTARSGGETTELTRHELFARLGRP
jgi:prolyl-tRNA synthetase